MKPKIIHGKFTAGKDFQCGENVTIDVEEDVSVGDRVTLGNNTYISGRRVTIGSDFFGYSHWNKRLEVGLGRRNHEYAILVVGHRCTFHDNKIDLTARVDIGNDVGLSPEVTIYTHYYWQSPLMGFPQEVAPVLVADGAIVGYRSTLLPGAVVPRMSVVGAHSLVAGNLGMANAVHMGVPAKFKKWIYPLPLEDSARVGRGFYQEYAKSLLYRGHDLDKLGLLVRHDGLALSIKDFEIDLIRCTGSGEEDQYSDDLRDFLFKKGIRIYTERRFKRLGES